MNILDILIIYLSCGAPLGVFYFLQNRKKLAALDLWLKTVLHFLFWIPFGFHLLRENSVSKNKFDKKHILDVKIENKVQLIQKQFEEFFLKNNLKISIFEFREIFDRYTGLTLALFGANKNQPAQKKAGEIFRISGHKNTELAAMCLQRRNQKQLLFHQNLARQDFLNIFSALFDAASEKQNLAALATEFVTLLNDLESPAQLEKIFGNQEQNEIVSEVKQSEKVLWKSETQKQQPAHISARLKTLAATMNLQGKD